MSLFSLHIIKNRNSRFCTKKNVTQISRPPKKGGDPSISFSPLLPVAVDLPMSPKAKNTVKPAIINANRSIATDFFTELLGKCNWVNYFIFTTIKMDLTLK